MEQQDHESFFSPKGIPAFASIIIFLVSFFIVMSLFHSVLNLFSEVRGYGMGYFFIGEGIMLLSVFIVTFLMMRFLDRRPFSDLGFSLKGRGKDILYGFLMAVLIYAIGFGYKVFVELNRTVLTCGYGNKLSVYVCYEFFARFIGCVFNGRCFGGSGCSVVFFPASLFSAGNKHHRNHKYQKCDSNNFFIHIFLLYGLC